MPRNISIGAQAEADGSSPIYTELYHIAFENSGNDIFVTPFSTASGSGNDSISFGGRIYESFNVVREDVETGSESQVPSLSLQFQNVDQQVGALILNNEIRGKRVTISGVFLDSTTLQPISQDNDDLVPIYNGRINSYNFDDKTVTLQLTHGITDTKYLAPKRYYDAQNFPFTIPILR